MGRFDLIEVTTWAGLTVWKIKRWETYLLVYWRGKINISFVKHPYYQRGVVVGGLWCLTPLSTIFQLYHGGQILLVEETGVPGENQRHNKLYHIMLYRVHLAWPGVELTTLVVINTDHIGSSNYHMITTTTIRQRGVWESLHCWSNYFSFFLHSKKGI